MQTIHLLIHGSELPLIEELYELTANDVININTKDGRVVEYKVRWPQLQVGLRLLEAEEAQPHLAQAQSLAQSALANRSDAKAQKNLRRVMLARALIEVTVDPELDADHRARDLILGVMACYPNSLLWADGALYNENAKRFIGSDDARVRYFVDAAPEDSIEATKRKQRSLAVLRREKIPFILHLPVITDSAQAALPTLDQVAARFIALVCVAERAEGGTLAQYEAQLVQRGGVATADEWAFARSSSPIDQDIVKFSRRLESAWVLAWALRLTDSLGRPDNFCPAEIVLGWAAKGADPLKQRAKLRSTGDILDMADLHYRYHWAVNDAELYGTQVPGRLIPAVVYERHYALNWLISGTAWDAVTTDT